jgi:hypothetical protein
MTKAKSDIMGTPDLTMNHSDPMADNKKPSRNESSEGAVSPIIPPMAEDDGLDRLIIENTDEITRSIDASDLGSLRDDIRAYTTNKIIEELEKLYLVYGSKDKPASLDNLFSLGKKGEVCATPIKDRIAELKGKL